MSLLAIVLLTACEKESITDLLLQEQSPAEVTESDVVGLKSSKKRDVCHNGNIININVNAIPDHQSHGDAVDMDGDGYFDMENDCGMPVDCDDTDDQLTDNCCNGGEIDSDGPLFVAPANEPGLYTWQEAIAACAAKDMGGYTWELPTIEELSDVHAAQGECFIADVYWSSSDHNGEKAFGMHFNTEYDGTPNAILYWVPLPCRCVRR